MKKYFLYILLACFSLSQMASATEIPNPTEALFSFLANFHSLSAHFSQIAYNANHSEEQRSAGTMALSRPDKFRWQIQTPNPQLLIADGRYLWIYDIDLSQATRQDFNKTKIDSPAFLLSGDINQLKSRFIVTRLSYSPDNVFKLVPKHTNDLFRWIEISFKGERLSHMRLLDNVGTTTVFNFSLVQINPYLSNALFQFKVPDGVEVLNN